VLNAEAKFLPELAILHADFPKLRIVLEHATTKDAIDMVKSLGDTVACTITAHHLAITVDDWAGQSLHFCKPVAKFPSDREALREVIRSGHPRFFLGSDSAPHPYGSKTTSSTSHGCAAGVYTSPILLPLLAHLLESFGALDKLEGFASAHGRNFYGFPVRQTQGKHSGSVRLRRGKEIVSNERRAEKNVDVVSFWAGKELGWKIVGE